MKKQIKSHQKRPRSQNKKEFSLPAKKKQLGQHFLRKQSVVDHMINKVIIAKEQTVLEIGCGDGFLTRSILEQTKCKRLHCIELDADWVTFVRNHVADTRLNIIHDNVLSFNFDFFEQEQPLILLANLPYQITFPIIFKLKDYKHLFQEGVIMIQEEVAQKITATHGRGYSATTLFLQHHFTWTKLEKIEPGAFSPPPKVFSRLLHFKPKLNPQVIPNEELFWKFAAACFKAPRQTLKNNLRTTHYDLSFIPEKRLKLRAQQLTFNDFFEFWVKINS